VSFSTTDTIVAVATPPGRGGIGVVRLSGPDARLVASRLVRHHGDLQPRHATLTTIVSAARADAGQDSTAIERAVVTYFPGPHSYTGEDVVELSAHGSPIILQAIVSTAMQRGARLAEPGEFTLRSFLNGRIDLPQAEAVADLVDAVTPLQARLAFDQLQGTLTRAIGEMDAALFDLIARLEASVDFPEEGYHFAERGGLAGALDTLLLGMSRLLADAARGRIVRDGLQVAIVGKPNVGKSSLFNALVGAARAIVTDVPGTTRDLVTEVVDMDGLRVTLVDTAGLRETDNVVEAEGVARSKGARAVADLTIVVLDGSRPLEHVDECVVDETIGSKRLIAVNKCDLAAAWPERTWPSPTVTVAATTGAGLDTLRREIARACDVETLADRPGMSNVRHAALMRVAHEALTRARRALDAQGGALSEEFVLADLQQARAALEEITGRRTSDDVLAHIFSKFCIGK
jgi:tRNA modification GTPase